MKRIGGLLAGLAASLLFCACGAGDEEAASVGDSEACEERAIEPTEAAQSTGEVEVDLQTASQALGCFNQCTAVSTGSLVGVCCVCNGVQKTFVRAVFNRNTYLCM